MYVEAIGLKLPECVLHYESEVEDDPPLILHEYIKTSLRRRPRSTLPSWGEV